MNDLKDLLELALSDAPGPGERAELAKFASGVQVLVAAQQGRG